MERAGCVIGRSGGNADPCWARPRCCVTAQDAGCNEWERAVSRASVDAAKRVETLGRRVRFSCERAAAERMTRADLMPRRQLFSMQETTAKGPSVCRHLQSIENGMQRYRPAPACGRGVTRDCHELSSQWICGSSRSLAALRHAHPSRSSPAIGARLGVSFVFFDHAAGDALISPPALPGRDWGGTGTTVRDIADVQIERGRLVPIEATLERVRTV